MSADKMLRKEENKLRKKQAKKYINKMENQTYTLYPKNYLVSKEAFSRKHYLWGLEHLSVV